jgi:hypothetical protein
MEKKFIVKQKESCSVITDAARVRTGLKRGRVMWCLVLYALLCTTGMWAQEITGSAGSDATVEPRHIVDMPTAGILKKSQLAFDVEFFQRGGILFGFSFGLLDRLTVGISYGGRQLIGSEEARFNPTPGFLVTVRIFEESIALPALVIGFDNQGREPYIDSTSRYTIKSSGAYVALSKNYSFLGSLSFHGGVNYSLERADDDKDCNGYIGIEKSIGPTFSLFLEYNIALNDNTIRAVGKGKGYLNAMISWSMGGGFTLGVGLKNLIENQDNIQIGNRILRIEYVRNL